MSYKHDHELYLQIGNRDAIAADTDEKGERTRVLSDWLQTLDNVPPEIREEKIIAALLGREIVFDYSRKLIDEQTAKTREAHDLSLTDPLTGLPSRRAFNIMHTELFRSSEPYGFLMIDIDHFKVINDTHKHSGGDEVLESFAARVSDQLRSSTSEQSPRIVDYRAQRTDTDFIARLGGEEFAVLLPGLSSGVTLFTRAQSIGRSVVESPFTISTGASVPVSVSIGCALREKGNNLYRHPLDVEKTADKAVYVSKRAGRNRTTYQNRTAVHRIT